MSWQLRQYLNVYDEFCVFIEQDKELLARIDQRLARLRERGNQVGEPISKFIEDGIFECRAKSAQHHARLLYCFQPGKQIVILLGILKDQRKLDRADIEEAKRRKTIIEARAEFISGRHKTH